MNIRTMALLITKKCNAECDICCFSCSPKIEDKMPLEEAIKYIKEASRINGIQTIGISGGEPFLFWDDLVQIITEAKKYKFRVTCATNGYWAVNRTVTYEKLVVLKKQGLDLISLSVDQFHKEYVPIANIKNILSVAKEIGMNVNIGCVVTKKSLRAWDITKEIGDDIINVSIMESACIPVGSAEEFIDENELFFMEKVPHARCKLLDTLAVMCNGDVYPCCSQAGASKPLYLGNLKTETIERIIKNFNANMYCRILDKYGTKWFFEKNIKNGLDIEIKERFVNKCDICYSLFKNEENVKKFQPFILEEKQKIYSKYLNSVNQMKTNVK